MAVALTLAATLFTAAPSVFAGNELAGSWTLRITIPESPDSTTTRTFIVTLDVSPRGENLHGRANITDQEGKTVGVAWRQVGKNVSIAYELPCPGAGPCASLILHGRVKGGGMLIKKGSVIVMWDTPNSRNPALYDTSNGSFRGDRLL
ncbi:MAG: hypothetical protein AABN33_00080 [Acidobacteriota bacterium]